MIRVKSFGNDLLVDCDLLIDDVMEQVVEGAMLEFMRWQGYEPIYPTLLRKMIYVSGDMYCVAVECQGWKVVH